MSSPSGQKKKRIGAGDPAFGPLPVGFQAFERSAHAFVGDGGGDDPLLETDLGCQLQGPQPALFAKIARTAMQEVFEALQPVLREAGMEPMGTRGAFVQHRQTRSVELVDHIVHGLVVAAQLASNFRGSFPTRRCSQDLAAAHHTGKAILPSLHFSSSLVSTGRQSPMVEAGERGEVNSEKLSAKTTER